MKEFTTWSELFFNSLQSFGQKIMETLPSVIGAFLILLIGWLFAKLVSRAIARLLKIVKFDIAADKVKATELLEKANVNLTPSQLIGKFFYWILLLLVIISATDAMGWEAVSNEVSKLLGFLPKLLVAMIFFVIGAFIAKFVRDIIKGTSASLSIGGGKIISSVVYYLLMILVTLTALEQAGMNISIITSNLLLILGAIMASAAISYGFASREVLSNILASFFSRKTFALGQTIEVDGVKGKIIDNNNISITIQTCENEKVVIPAHQLITSKVKIIG